MGPRNLLILFFSTVAVSLVILIIFFSLFFKNVSLDFETRLPESAPELGGRFDTSAKMNPQSKADGLLHSTINVPPEHTEPPPVSRTDTEEEEELLPNDSDLPPISDDVMLQESPPAHRVEPAVEPSSPPTNPAPAEAEPSGGPPVPMQGNAAPPPATTYRVVLGKYASRQAADQAATQAAASGLTPLVKQIGARYAVQLGSFSSRRNAEALAGKVLGASVE